MGRGETVALTVGGSHSHDPGEPVRVLYQVDRHSQCGCCACHGRVRTVGSRATGVSTPNDAYQLTQLGTALLLP